MVIIKLQLSNFRNFTNRKIEFEPKLTVIIGPNGSGKTNILEAIVLLCGMRLVHVQSDLDMVRFGQSEARVEGTVYGQVEGRKVLTVNLQVLDELRVKKSYLIDSLKKRLIDFLSLASIIIFEPRDLDLVEGSPALRRHHLDTFLSNLDKDYWRNISAYNKIVVRRNKVLQRILEGKSKPAELDFWDERLIEHSKYISKKRQEFFEFLSTKAGLARMLWSGFSWQLKQSLLTEEKLLKNRERDIAAGMTLSGLHRDDFRFIFKNKDLAYFGSRGEQRMATLALKLAELEYFKIKRGTQPMLALDDIFSELDWQHREAILSIIGNQQTIITAAERDSVPKELLKKAKIINLN